jgi:hypothetical protein
MYILINIIKVLIIKNIYFKMLKSINWNIETSSTESTLYSPRFKKLSNSLITKSSKSSFNEFKSLNSKVITNYSPNKATNNLSNNSFIKNTPQHKRNISGKFVKGYESVYDELYNKGKSSTNLLRDPFYDLQNNKNNTSLHKIFNKYRIDYITNNNKSNDKSKKTLDYTKEKSTIESKLKEMNKSNSMISIFSNNKKINTFNSSLTIINKQPDLFNTTTINYKNKGNLFFNIAI